MIKVTPFHQTKVEHKPMRSFAQNALFALGKYPEEPFFKRAVTSLEGLLEEMDAAFHRNLKSGHTVPLEKLDGTRDNCTKAILQKLTAASYERFISEVKADAAESLLEEFSKMGSRPYLQSYQKQSASTIAFLKATAGMETEKELTGTTYLFQLLGETQYNFDKTFNEKAAAGSPSEDVRLISEIRRDLDYRIDSLLSYIDSLALDLPETYDPLVNEMNELIKDTMAKAKAEETRNAE